MYSRVFANLLIGLLSLWAIYSIVSTAFGVFIVFPLRAVDERGSVRDGRLQSIRLAVCWQLLLFTALCISCKSSKEVYPIHFLKTFLFSLGWRGGFFAFERLLKMREMFHGLNGRSSSFGYW